MLEKYFIQGDPNKILMSNWEFCVEIQLKM